MGTIWNTYAFFVLYANIDNFDPTKYTLEYDKLTVMDKWMLSRLNTLIKTVDENLENYKITETSRVLQEFVDDLSNWYVRRSRERFWAKGMEQDKINAYMTLYTVLVELSKVCAPMIPFMSDEIYLNLVGSVDKNAPESVHLCDFPLYNEKYIDSALELNMKQVLDVVVLGRACRNSANIKNRQPIGKMYVKADFQLPDLFVDIIEEELNVKAVEFTGDVKGFTSYSFKPQLKTVGPKYGKQLGAIRTALSELDGNAAMETLEVEGSLKFNFDGIEVVLTKDDLLISTAQTTGFESVSDYGITVALDTNLTPELVEEGIVRELVSKIQTMRKDSGFEVMDNIVLYIYGNDKIVSVAKANKDDIMSDVLARELRCEVEYSLAKEWDINGEKVIIGVEKV